MPDCACELVQQKQQSPGVVLHQEDLLRVAFKPIDVDAISGQLKLEAIKKAELNENRYSLARLQHTAFEVLKEQVIDAYLHGKPERIADLVARVPCADIRAIRLDGGEQAFCVADDGREGFEGHAVMGFSDPTKAADYWNGKTNTRTALRLALVKCFQAKLEPLTNLAPVPIE